MRPSGNARAATFGDSPSARITNLYVSNGKGSFEDLIGGIEFGLYCCDALAGSLQHSRYALTTGYGHVIRNGRLAELVHPVVLAGDSPRCCGESTRSPEISAGTRSPPAAPEADRARSPSPTGLPTSASTDWRSRGTPDDPDPARGGPAAHLCRRPHLQE
jgi:hypothetical protein